jgi:hypothetical protein
MLGFFVGLLWLLFGGEGALVSRSYLVLFVLRPQLSLMFYQRQTT